MFTNLFWTMHGNKRRYLIRFPCILLLVCVLAEIAPFGNSAAAQQAPDRILTHQSQEKPSILRRVALVIGNSAYVNAPHLKNAANDATDMAATLTELGFKVVVGTNLSQREMKSRIREFGQDLKTGGVGLFYFAGHGVQSKGRNYLIPVDADIQSEAELEDASVDVSLVLNFMDEAHNDLNMVFLDACRNNPFARSFRSANNGLASMDAPTGTFIGYATGPGRVASDGGVRNGIFTAELMKQIRVPGLTLSDMFMRVRLGVFNQTNKQQVPWEASSVIGAFYFKDPIVTNNSNLSSSVTNTDPKNSINVVVNQITHGPAQLTGGNSAYSIKDSAGQSILIKLGAKIVNSNTEDWIRNNIVKDNTPSHLWDDKSYYWRVPSGAMLLLSWRDLTKGNVGWVLVQKYLNVWWYKSNTGEWKSLSEGGTDFVYWLPGDRNIRITLEIPKPGNGWTTDDVKYRFGY